MLGLLVLGCAGAMAQEDTKKQERKPPSGTPEKEYSQRIAKEWDPAPSKIIANLKSLAARFPQSAEKLLRDGYHLLNASIVGKDWDEIWPHLKDPNLFDVEMWSARQADWYFYRFGVQRKAWTSDGGAPHDLVLGLTVAHEVSAGKRTRRTIHSAEAILRADLKSRLEDLRKTPRYAARSVFQLVIETDSKPPDHGPMPFIASIEANYQPFRDRWSEVWDYRIHAKAEFCDAPEAPVRTWGQTFYATSDLDPLLTWKMEVLDADPAARRLEAGHVSAWGGSGSYPGKDGHGFRRLDLAPAPRDGC